MRRVPYSVIAAVKAFDPEAVITAFRHFEEYMTSQCLIDYTDEHGNTHSSLDDDLHYQAEIAPFRAIDGFQFNEPPDNFMT